MQPNSLCKAKRHRVSVHLITLVAVVLVAVVFAGCRSDTNKNGSTEQTSTGQSPSPTPTPASTPKKRMLPGDTIIVIKGGSVSFEVNKTLCNDDDDPLQPNEKKYKCNSIELDDIVILTADGQPPPRCPKAHGNTKFTFDGEGGKELEVKGNGNHVTIKFKIADYPLCTGGSAGQHCGSGTNQVGTVTVDSTVSKNCDSAAKCEIWIRKKP